MTYELKLLQGKVCFHHEEPQTDLEATPAKIINVKKTSFEFMIKDGASSFIVDRWFSFHIGYVVSSFASV